MQPDASAVLAENPPFAADARPCPIVLACDERYAMPLATTLRSLAESNRAHWPLDVHVLTDGFSESARDRVLRSQPLGAMQIRWIAVDLQAFEQFGLLDHVSRMTYARLQIPRVFGEDIAEVLYMDADVLVLGDLGGLWSTDLEGAPIGAVTDHHVDADLKLGRHERTQGVPRVAHYFNAGILLMNLAAWRRQGVAERALDYLRLHRESPYSDQDALNVACDGLWKPLARTWNYQDHHCIRIGRLPAAARPAIVHFITSTKPWKPSSSSVNAGLYDSFRDRTQFRRSPEEKVRDAVSTLSWRIRYRVQRMNLRRQGPQARLEARQGEQA
jgi:lipopolysaccharide biosynthesis glycosyltransferase